MNLPTNSSISVTLSQDDLRTLTTASCSPEFEQDQLWLNGKLESLASERTQACLKDLRTLRALLEKSDTSLPKLSEYKLHIVSENNFPTAAGLASSAAGFAALVFSISKLYELPQDLSEISKIARKGSGSACRSLFGGYVAWEMGELTNGEDSKAVEIAPISHWSDMKALILVVSDDKKDVPSTSGMQNTVATSDLFDYRIKQVVPKRFDLMKQAILDKDFPKFAELTMKDSNSFHSVCLDSFPPIFYLNDTSKKIIKLIHKINELNGETVVAYTFDAGPNAVLYYEAHNEEKVLSGLLPYFQSVPGFKTPKAATHYPFNNFIAEINGVSKIIATKVGNGPTQVEDSLINESGLPKN